MEFEEQDNMPSIANTEEELSKYGIGVGDTFSCKCISPDVFLCRKLKPGEPIPEDSEFITTIGY